MHISQPRGFFVGSRTLLVGLLPLPSRNSSSRNSSSPSLLTRSLAIAPLLLCLFALLPGKLASQSAHAKPKAATVKAKAKPRVAVLYFDYSGNDEEMAFLRKGMAQMLVTDLSSADDLQIVERIDLEAVLKELKLGESRNIDKSSRARIGKLLGARYLVTGGYFQFKNSLRVDAKIIDVERGTTKSFAAQAAPSDFMQIEAELTNKLRDALLQLNAKNAKTAAISKRRNKVAKSGKAPKVAARTVARYGRALDAMDKGNTTLATTELKSITREAPDFAPAVSDLRVLLR